MATHNVLGQIGEGQAVEFLMKAGYRILEQNWRVGHREVDIICTDGDLIIIVEVKSRTGEVFYPDELLDYKKRRNLRSAGEAYIHLKGIDKELRFDLVIIEPNTNFITHIKEAIQIFD